MRKILIASLLITGLFAQDRGERQRPEQRGPEDQKKQEQRENRKQVWLVAQQTEHLKLTEEQAEKLFPRMRDHRLKLGSIHDEHRKMMDEMRDKIERGDEIKNKEIRSHLKKDHRA